MNSPLDDRFYFNVGHVAAPQVALVADPVQSATGEIALQSEINPRIDRRSVSRTRLFNSLGGQVLLVQAFGCHEAHFCHVRNLARTECEAQNARHVH